MLNEPLLTLYNLLAFILRKELGASAFQLSILSMLVPVVSLFSLYWSHALIKRPQRLLQNVLILKALSLFPFIFFPLLENPWSIIACTAFYMMLFRGLNPAWMEILKLKMDKETLSSAYAFGSSLGFTEGLLIASPLALLLEWHSDSWRYLFPFAAALSMCGAFFQSKISLEKEAKKKQYNAYKPCGNSLWQRFLDPWKMSIALLKKRPDFLRFQWGFMLAGFGMMLARPAQTIYLSDVLEISYTDALIAFSICKGLGFIIASPLLARLFNKINIFSFTSIASVSLSFHFLFLILAKYSNNFMFVSFFFYGFMQAASHLSWNLSGPVFAKDQDSSLFSSLNVLSVGLRGAVAPALGALLLSSQSPLFIISFASLFCVVASLFFQYWGQKQASLQSQMKELQNYQV